jgi:hypothetical protein
MLTTTRMLDIAVSAASAIASPYPSASATPPAIRAAKT